MSPGFSFLFSSCRLVGASRAVSSSWCSLVAMGVSCGSARWRLVVVPGRHSFILRRGGVLALILRLSSRSLLVPPSRVASRCSFPMSCWLGRRGVLAHIIVVLLFSWSVAGRGAGASCRACPVSSDCSSRAVGRGVHSRLGERLVVGSSSMVCPLRWRGVLAVPVVSFRPSVSWSGDGLASRFILAEADGRRFPSCRPGAGACLPRRRRGMWRCRSRLLPIILWLRGMGSVRYPLLCSLSASCSRGLSLSSRFACLVRDDGTEDGRRGGGMLGYRDGARHDLSIDVYNEYDICDVYKRYKNTRIREYDGYMGRCRWDDSDAACYAGR